ncbi:MAG: hypothetical protein AAGM38_17060 [Pseudomonadota bacterium]
MKTRVAASALALMAMISAGPAAAELVPRAQYVGTYGVSTDGWGALGGSNAGARGAIRAKAPPGSTVISAFLYTATQSLDGMPTTVTLDGSKIEYAQRVANPSISAKKIATNRADVTAIVAPKIETGSGEIHSFTIDEGRDGRRQGGTDVIDGHALVVLFDNPSLPERSVAVLDGFLSTTGDKAVIDFKEPLDTGSPGFVAEMALGISFSTTPSQQSFVRVNGAILTENAGNYDDGARSADGSLITVGSFDDPISPRSPSYSQDKERYNIAPLLEAGASEIEISVKNPSGDDNIFLATFMISGDATVENPNAEAPMAVGCCWPE